MDPRVREDDAGRGMDPRVREDDTGRGMDPRVREDDGSSWIPACARMTENTPSCLPAFVIPAEPALDLIGGQESIPVFFPTVNPP
jgi:hypothetical protein